MFMRERYTTEVRQKIVALLESEFEARMTDFTPVFTVGPLVRLHVVVWKDEGTVPDVSGRAAGGRGRAFRAHLAGRAA